MGATQILKTRVTSETKARVVEIAPERAPITCELEFDESLERLSISVLRGSDKGHVSFAGKAVGRSNRGFLFVDVVHECG